MLKASITVTDNGLIAKSFIPEDKVIKDKASYKDIKNYINPKKGQFWVGLGLIGLIALLIKRYYSHAFL